MVRFLPGALLLGLLGCGSSAPKQPPFVPPSPKSVSRTEPGGDAHDPHWAALTRLLEEPWGRRNDKDDQLLLPLIDVPQWKRVRYWGVDHFVGFRYGDDHHVVTIGFVQEVPEGEAVTSASCMRRFETWVRPQIRGYELKLRDVRQRKAQFRDKSVQIKLIDGFVDAGFMRKHFSAAWAGYPAYPRACLIYAMAVPWGEHEELARKVRDRWVREGFGQVHPLTETRPYRKED